MSNFAARKGRPRVVGQSSSTEHSGGLAPANDDHQRSAAYAGPKPLLFIHGSLASKHMWAPYVEVFAPSRRTLAVDLYGYGDAAPWSHERPLRLADEVALIRTAISDLGAPVDVVAHSFGAVVALRLALQHPQSVDSLTLIEPVSFNILRHLGPQAAEARAEITPIAESFNAAGGDLSFALVRFVDYWNGKGSFAALAADKRAMLIARAGQVARDFEAVFGERLPLAAYRRLPHSTLVVTGSASPSAALVASKAVARLAPRGWSITIDGAGHMLPFTHAPSLKAILLERLGASSNVAPRAA